MYTKITNKQARVIHETKRHVLLYKTDLIRK